MPHCIRVLMGSLLLGLRLAWAQSPLPEEPAPPHLPAFSLGGEVGLPFTNYRFDPADPLDIRSPYRPGFYAGVSPAWNFAPRWALRLPLGLSWEQARLDVNYGRDSLIERVAEPVYLMALPVLQWSGGPRKDPHLLLGLGAFGSLNLARAPDTLRNPKAIFPRSFDAGGQAYVGVRFPLGKDERPPFMTIKASYRAGLGNVIRDDWPLPTVSVLSNQAWMLSLIVE